MITTAPARSGVPGRIIRGFLNANRRGSGWIERHLPQARRDPFELYDQAVCSCLNRLSSPLIADIGGGRSCSFVSAARRHSGSRIVAVDISAEELRHNNDVDEKRQADVAQELPFSDGEVDLLVSRTVLEHVRNVEAFIALSTRVVSERGYVVHLVPCRYAPFAVIGRLLPFEFARSILHFLRPESIGVVEFPVYYDKCNNSAFNAALNRHGFELVDAKFSYYQSNYYDAFLPAYCLSALYEILIQLLDCRDLAAYMVIVARKTA